MKYYIDTSSLVALYVPEKHTKTMFELVIKVPESLYISRLVEIEFHSALAIKTREKQIEHSFFKKVSDAFFSHIEQGKFQRLFITDEMLVQAAQFLKKNTTALRTLDAIHLSCASFTDTTLVTSDKVLAKSAQHFKVNVQFV